MTNRTYNVLLTLLILLVVGLSIHTTRQENRINDLNVRLVAYELQQNDNARDNSRQAQEPLQSETQPPVNRIASQSPPPTYDRSESDDGKPVTGFFLRLPDTKYGFVRIDYTVASGRHIPRRKISNISIDEHGELSNTPTYSKEEFIPTEDTLSYFGEIVSLTDWTLDKEYQLLDETQARLYKDLYFERRKPQRIILRKATFYQSYASASKALADLKM